MPEYKLIYFNFRGRAELTRWIFSYAGIPFTDERIEREDWPAVKNTIPFGKLPCLVIDGKHLPQSYAIARYAAKEAGLVPEGKLQAAYCDAVVDTMNDIALELYKIFSKNVDEAEKKKLFAEIEEKTVVPALSYMNKRLEENDWIVSDKITWADMAIGCMMTSIVKVKEDILQPYPKVAAHVQKVRSLPKIKEWIEKAPKTEW